MWKTGSSTTPLAFQLVDTKDIEGSWCCCCCVSPALPGWACFTKKALDEDTFQESGYRGCCLIPLIPFNEVRTRIYVNGHPTNGFFKHSKEEEHDWYRDSGCVGASVSCSRKC